MSQTSSNLSQGVGVSICFSFSFGLSLSLTLADVVVQSRVHVGEDIGVHGVDRVNIGGWVVISGHIMDCWGDNGDYRVVCIADSSDNTTMSQTSSDLSQGVGVSICFSMNSSNGQKNNSKGSHPATAFETPRPRLVPC